MKFFAFVSRKLERCIYSEKFSRKFQNPVIKILFIMYGFLGGFCFDDLVNKYFRKAWIAFNIFNFVVVNVSCLFYYYDLKMKNFISVSIPLVVLCGIGAKIGVYLFTYLFRNEVRNLFEDLNKKNEIKKCVAWSGDFSESRENMNSKVLMKKLSFMFTFFMIFTLSYSLEKLVTNVEKLTKNEHLIYYYYPLYFPYEKTIVVNSAIRVFQIVTILPEIMIVITIPIFFCVCAAEIYNRYLCLRENLRCVSHTIFQNIENTYDSEMAMAEYKIPSSKTQYSELKIKRVHLQNEFLSNMVDCVKYHQKLNTTTNLFVNFAKYFISIAHAMTVLVLMTIGFLVTCKTKVEDGILSEMERNVDFIGCIPFVLLYTVPWLLFCNIGNQIEKMNEMIADEVYASPWYHLAPGDRKIILNFLTLAQHHAGIYAWKIYPVNLALFPLTMNTVYSQIQILRTLQQNLKN